MQPIEAYYRDELEMADPTPLLIVGFTAAGEAIVIDGDGNIYTTDQDLITRSPRTDWPVGFIDQFTARRERERMLAAQRKETVPA